MARTFVRMLDFGTRGGSSKKGHLKGPSDMFTITLRVTGTTCTYSLLLLGEMEHMRLCPKCCDIDSEQLSIRLTISDVLNCQVK